MLYGKPTGLEARLLVHVTHAIHSSPAVEDLLITHLDPLLPLVRQDTANSYHSQGTDIPHLPQGLAASGDSITESTHDQDYEEV